MKKMILGAALLGMFSLGCGKSKTCQPFSAGTLTKCTNVQACWVRPPQSAGLPCNYNEIQELGIGKEGFLGYLWFAKTDRCHPRSPRA